MSPTDKPDQAIIDDDAELDRWAKQYEREMAKKLKKPGGDSQYPLL